MVVLSDNKALQPIELDAQTNLILKKILVFEDAGRIVLSLIGHKGTLSLPLGRKTAASLSASLTRHLVEPAA
jgi:hypothetical protein